VSLQTVSPFSLLTKKLFVMANIFLLLAHVLNVVSKCKSSRYFLKVAQQYRVSQRIAMEPRQIMATILEPQVLTKAVLVMNLVPQRVGHGRVASGLAADHGFRSVT
jgi:hypothetical protein